MYFTFNNQTFTSNELSSNLFDIKKSFQIGGKTDTIKNITDILKHFSFFQIQAFAKSYADRIGAESVFDVLTENSGKGI